MHFAEWKTIYDDVRVNDDALYIPHGSVEWCRKSWENFYDFACNEPSLQQLWEQRFEGRVLDAGKAAACHIVRMHAEFSWYGLSTPYFRVWPDTAEMLANVPSDFPTQVLALPFAAFVLRLPDDFNGLVDSTGEPITSALVGCTQDGTDADADQAIVITANNGVSLAAPIPRSGNVSAMWEPYENPYVRLGQLVASLSYLAVHGDKAVRPDVLSRDLAAYAEAERTGDKGRMGVIEQRALRRGKNGFVVKELTFERTRPLFSAGEHGDGSGGHELQHRHFRRPHFRTISESKAVMVKGCIVTPDLPPAPQSTGYDLK